MRKWKKYDHKYTWKSLVVGLSCVVAVSAICALTLPAIAMDNQCGLQEHQHADECYAQLTEDPQEPTNGERTLVCDIPEHIHTDECKKQQNDVPPEPVDAEESAPTLQTEVTEVTEDQQSVLVPEETVQSTQESNAPGRVETEPKEQSGLDDMATVPQQPAPETPATEPEKKPEEETAEFVGEKGPIDVNPYVRKARLRYKDKNGSVWQDMQEGVAIPGDAKLRLDIEYAHVKISRLIASGCQLRFEVPKIMRNPVAQGEIKDESNETIGTITDVGHILTLTFEKSWLEKIQNTSDNFLDGTFYVQSEINLSEVPKDGTALDIVFGDVHIKPSFGTDSIAQYGTLTIQKVVSKHVTSENNDHYLEYTLTVTAGNDGSPDVRVVDYFLINGEYAEYIGITQTPQKLTGIGIPREEIAAGKEYGEIYLGAAPTQQQPIPPENGVDIPKPGSLVWVIGNMEANEQRTLTYRVRLSDEHAHKVTEQPLRNKAEVFSKTYKKDDSVVDFVPKVDLEMKKSHSTPVRNPEDGTHRITYTVWIEAPSSNNHVLGEVTMTDSLRRTDAKALPYIRYDEASFKLYHSKRPEGKPLELNKADGSHPRLQYTADKKEFTVSVGNVAPGEAYCMQYDVIVDAKAFGAANVDQLAVKNRVEARADNAHLPGKDFIQAYQDDCNIGYRNWIKKTVSNPLAEELTVALSQSHVYDATGGTITEDANVPQNFKVPAGGYPYSITFNHLGDWDITRAEISDALSEKYVQYSGYLQVDAFDATAKGDTPLGKLVETHWVKIDGMKSFRLQLSDIGFTNNSYAYRFTYYVVPVDIGAVHKVNVGNTANIIGTVGREGDEFQIGNFGSRVEITIQGGHSIEAVKKPWFYERPIVSRGIWSNGAIHWGIKIDGSELHEGTIIKDFVKNEGAHHERGKIYFRGDSFVGIFKGKLPDGIQFYDYSDVRELLNSGYVTQLSTDEYCEVTYKDELKFNQENTYSAVYVKMRQSIPLENGESVFLILKSEPDPLPTGVRTKKLYTNYLDVGTSPDTMVNHGMATKELYGGQNILKEFGSFVQFDGTKLTELKTGKGGVIPQHLLKEPGHYIAWASKVNYGGDLAGTYRILDQIPKGTEIAYARLKWIGEKTRNSGIQMAQIPNYQEELGPDWTEHTVQAEMDERLGNAVSYYYTNGDQVVWEVQNLKAGHEEDAYAVDFQIVCRVTDPEVLQGGVEKEFVNQVHLHQTDGTHLDSSSSGVSVSVHNISKTSVTEENHIHFTIELNQTGEDLLKDGDTVILVDEMSPNMSLDIESIRIENSRTKKPVAVKPAYDGQVLTIPIPDNQPLTINYTVHIHAIPDTHITLSNHAYWMGFSKNGGDSVLIEDFYYQIGGTAGSSGTPKVQILKYNQNNIAERLPGAEFQMEEGTMENGIFHGNGKVWNGTTGADGTLLFGTGRYSDEAMEYNVVYQIKETRAPDGFVLDPDPHYFIMAQKVGDGYPAYPEGVHVHYASAIHVFKAPNAKGEATVEKRFQNADGTEIKPIPGQYRFGLFDNHEGTGKPIQIVMLNFTETSADQVGTFTDLDLDQKYYVFELDEASNPIQSGSVGYVNGTPFQVNYTPGLGTEVHEVTNGSSITITNKLCIDSLPETGGIGRTPFLLAGLFLMCSAIGIAFFQSGKRKYSK